ncbi:MAG: preprotein translocase subunit YajC [Alphaproteobacteria bacterium]|nr:preprotein translocase subunit YajC [Alphaproteobacteria bacterium]
MNTVDFSSFLPLILVFCAMYFFVIRPQSKKNKEHKDMLSSLQKKDRVITSGGLLGHVHSIGEKEIQVELAPGTVVTVLRTMIAQKVPTSAATSSPKAAVKAEVKPKPVKTAKAAKPTTKKKK